MLNDHKTIEITMVWMPCFQPWLVSIAVGWAYCKEIQVRIDSKGSEPPSIYWNFYGPQTTYILCILLIEVWHNWGSNCVKFCCFLLKSQSYCNLCNPNKIVLQKSHLYKPWNFFFPFFFEVLCNVIFFKLLFL